MGTSIPRRNEKGSPPSEIKIYTLTPEELTALDKSKPIPRSHSKPINFNTPTRKNKQLEEQPAMSNIVWYEPQRKIEGPAITFYTHGFGISQAGSELTGFKNGDKVEIGIDCANKTLYIRTGEKGVKINDNRNKGLRSSGKGLSDWATKMGIKKQKYALVQSDEIGIFKAALEFE